MTEEQLEMLISALEANTSRVSQVEANTGKTEDSVHSIADTMRKYERLMYGNGEPGLKAKVEIHDRDIALLKQIVFGTIGVIVLAVLGALVALVVT